MNTHKQVLPEEYNQLDDATLDQRIRKAKATLGSRLVILGHHYQKDEVIEYSDFRGDSLKLAQLAAQEQDADYIVFCGVHFMAETADILTGSKQKVILPDLMAGCSMADMANIDQVEECWQVLKDTYHKDILPITYVNSTADIKAFCGRHGGLTCTSSNAGRVFDWALTQDKIILFMPDEHLGRNTGATHGISAQEMLLWDPEAIELELPQTAPRLVLWQGFCSVHQKFTTQHVDSVRQNMPGVKVIVHPECSREVVEKADLNGSTEYIIRQISESAAGTKWAIGTELNLVNRLAQTNPDKQIVSLNPSTCLCDTMNRIDRPHLLWALENLVNNQIVNQITVDSQTATDAVLALDRMLSIS